MREKNRIEWEQVFRSRDDLRSADVEQGRPIGPEPSSRFLNLPSCTESRATTDGVDAGLARDASLSQHPGAHVAPRRATDPLDLLK